MKLFPVFILSALFLLPTTVRATTAFDITSSDVGQTYAIDWMDPTSSTGLSTNLSATGDFTVKSLTSSELLLGVTLNNTTSSSFQAAILALGMSSSPSVSGKYVGTSTVFTGISDPGNFPGGFKNINICLFSGGNVCDGGDINNGLQSGSSTSFELALTTSTGNLLSSGIDLSQFPVKFQTQSGSFELGGSTLTATPEPSSLILASTGLLMILAFYRKTIPQKHSSF